MKRNCHKRTDEKKDCQCIACIHAQRQTYALHPQVKPPNHHYYNQMESSIYPEIQNALYQPWFVWPMRQPSKSG